MVQIKTVGVNGYLFSDNSLLDTSLLNFTCGESFSAALTKHNSSFIPGIFLAVDLISHPNLSTSTWTLPDSWLL